MVLPPLRPGVLGARVGVAVAVAAVALGAGACGDDEPVPEPQAVSLQEAIRVSREAGVALAPAAPGATAIDAAVARRSLEHEFGVAKIAATEPMLAVVDQADVGDHLVWAFVGREGCCVRVFLADADDGRYLMEYSEPRRARWGP